MKQSITTSHQFPLQHARLILLKMWLGTIVVVVVVSQQQARIYWRHYIFTSFSCFIFLLRPFAMHSTPIVHCSSVVNHELVTVACKNWGDFMTWKKNIQMTTCQVLLFVWIEKESERNKNSFQESSGCTFSNSKPVAGIKFMKRDIMWTIWR